MANNHFLILDVIETSNCSVLNVIDTSIYTDDIPMDCGELLITPPGFNAPVLTTVQKDFNLKFTPCSINNSSSKSIRHNKLVPSLCLSLLKNFPAYFL